ncbi:Raftlin [Fukomys damarensis]|uniref:Raftlin n=1 Tax=Fukomys damarensis TaxID=885580 RepID=A0A091CLZ6_FUKDA|nr:Raftlin [Fukomys damarensis]
MGCGLNKLEKRDEKRPGNIYSTLKRPQVETKVDVAYEYRFLEFTTLSAGVLLSELGFDVFEPEEVRIAYHGPETSVPERAGNGPGVTGSDGQGYLPRVCAEPLLCFVVRLVLW